MQKITPFLWFDTEAEEAVNFYASVFPEAKIGSISRYPEGSPGPVGEVMTVEFQLFGQNFVALNGGPAFQFTEAVSFMVECEDQAEVDRYWNLLSEGGEVQACGWVKDKYGLSWQITPRLLMELVTSPDKAKADAAFKAMLEMEKIEIATIQEAVAKV